MEGRHTPIAAILGGTYRVPLSPGSIQRPTPWSVDGSVMLPDALRAPRKPGSPCQIGARYPRAVVGAVGTSIK